MDSQKTGRLIAALRREKGWTQKQLAEAMHLSDRTVSKWERGAGCPELSLLPELSGLLGVAVEHLLSGELGEREADKGDMKRVQFYLCPSCGNLLCRTGTAEISCCGRKLEPLQAKPADKIHRLTVEEVEDEFFVTSSHPMEKAHYLSFIALVTCDRAVLVRLYPEQSVQVRLPRMRRGKLYACCSEGGLWETAMK